MMKIPGEHVGVSAKCLENAGEFLGNVSVCVQCTIGMQGNARNTRGMYGCGCKVPGEFRGMPGGCKGMGEMCQEKTGCQGNV